MKSPCCPSAKFLAPALAACLSTCAGAAITDPFDTFPSGGIGWSAASWTTSSTGSPSTSTASGTVRNTTPLNGGGNYLSVSTTSNNAATGIRRSIGTTAASPYTVTFDWRLDSVDNVTDYDNRVHIGASGAAETGSTNAWSWLIGVVGGDNSNDYYDGNWYVYHNTSTTADGAFTRANMIDTGISLTQSVVYSFFVDVDPLSQTYDVIISGSDSSYYNSATNNPGGLNFRNQTNSNNASNIILGTANTSTSTTREFSVDNLSIVPEPSSAVLLGSCGVLGLLRRRRA